MNVRYRPDRWISAAQYQINNWGWNNLPIISGNWNSPDNDIIYKVAGLNPNTNYEIETRIQYQGALWTKSGKKSFTTNDISKIKTAYDFNIGDMPKITFSGASNGCSIRAYLERIDKIGGKRIDDISSSKSVSGTECIFNYDKNLLYSKVPNSNKGYCRFCLVTKCNDKEYWNSIDKQFFVVNSNPQFTNFEYQDINQKTVALTGNNQILVNNFSDLKIIISSNNKAIAKNAATMKNYKAVCGTKNISKDYANSVDMSLYKIDSSSIRVYATDSRGNSAFTDKKATIKDYFPVAITRFTATRQKNGIGSEVLLNYEGRFWNKNFGQVQNTIQNCIYNYKETASNTWKTGETKLNYSINREKFIGQMLIKGDLGADGFNIRNTYNIRLIVSDKLVTNYVDFIIPSGEPALAIAKQGVAIKKKYDKKLGGALQVNGQIFALDPKTNTYIDLVSKINEILKK